MAEETHLEEKSAEIPILNLDEMEEVRKSNPKAPWKYQRALNAKGAGEFITIEDLYNKISAVKNIRDKALMTIIYLCGARVEEIVRFEPKRFGKTMMRVVRKGRAKNMLWVDYDKKKEVPIQQSIKPSDITQEKVGDRDIVKFRIRNLKSRDSKKGYKIIPVPLDNEINRKFLTIVKQYISLFQREEELFPITARRADQIINKELQFNPHFFRDLRLTHLVKYHNFTDQKLITFAGWADSRPAKHYIKIGWKDLISSM
jgi:integrase